MNGGRQGRKGEKINIRKRENEWRERQSKIGEKTNIGSEGDREREKGEMKKNGVRRKRMKGN